MNAAELVNAILKRAIGPSTKLLIETEDGNRYEVKNISFEANVGKEELIVFSAIE